MTCITNNPPTLKAMAGKASNPIYPCLWFDSEGGEEVQCGWLKDRYGVSWQIVPAVLASLMNDPSRSERVVNAFLRMKKFDIEKLLKA